MNPLWEEDTASSVQRGLLGQGNHLFLPPPVQASSGCGKTVKERERRGNTPRQDGAGGGDYGGVGGEPPLPRPALAAAAQVAARIVSHLQQMAHELSAVVPAEQVGETGAAGSGKRDAGLEAARALAQGGLEDGKRLVELLAGLLGRRTPQPSHSPRLAGGGGKWGGWWQWRW